MLTGNGVAFILRVPGTRHGDWWSLQGVGIFAAAAAVSLLSKYVIRTGGRHLFNPSNFGLVAVFLVLGTRAVNPQDLWWGPMSPGLLLTLGIIVTGGLVIVRRLDMLGLTVGFWLTFAAASALEQSFPPMISGPFKFVRNNSPIVPSRLSELRQSAVRAVPMRRQ